MSFFLESAVDPSVQSPIEAAPTERGSGSNGSAAFSDHGRGLAPVIDFNGYPKLERLIEEQYGFAYARYPHAMLVLDTVVREYEQGNSKQVEVNLSGLAKFSWFNAFYPTYLRLAGLASLGMPKRRLFTSVVKARRFEERLIGICESNGIDCGPAKGSRFRRRAGIFALERILLLNAAISQFSTRRALKRVWQQGILRSLHSHTLMERLDRAVRRDVRRLEWIVTHFGIELILMEDASSGGGRLVSTAARNVGAKTIVVAHGYVVNRFLVTICPVRSDALVLWTKAQANEIGRMLPPVDRRRLYYVGYPLHGPMHQTPPKGKHLLFVSEPLGMDGRCDENLEALAPVVAKLRDFGYRIRFRLHPKDWRTQEVAQGVRSWGVELSFGNLQDALREADIVVGSNSSCLVEAAYQGKIVFQIAEFARNEYEGAERVSIDKIPISLEKAFQTEPRQLDDYDDVRMDAEILAMLGELAVDMRFGRGVTEQHS